MSGPPPGNPQVLRDLALQLQRLGSADLDAVAELLTAGIRLGSAYPEGEGAWALRQAVTRPCGSLDGTGRLLQSAVPLLIAHAEVLETQQAAWATAQAELDAVLAAGVQRLLAPVPWVAASPESLQARTEAATASQLSAQHEVVHSEVVLCLGLDPIIAGLDALQARTVLVGGAPASGAPGLGSFGHGPPLSLTDLAAVTAFPSGDGHTAAAWWAGLSPQLREALVHTRPEQVGAMTGLPAGARDQANQLLLERDLELYRTRLAAGGLELDALVLLDKELLVNLRVEGWTDADISTLTGMLRVREQLRRIELETGAAGQLVIYEPAGFDGQGRVAISVGDLDSAPAVAVLVPGMTSDVPGYLDNQVGNALTLSRETAAQYGTETAVVAWIGYDAPGFGTSVMSKDLATEGAELLAADLAGFTAGRDVPATRTVVVGHSYGSTTTSLAFAKFGATADALVLAQSPGAGGAGSVQAYTGVPADEVYVLTDSADPVVWFGRAIPLLGPDPGSDGFGATAVDSESGAILTSAHSQVYTVGGPALAGLTAILAGRRDQLVPATKGFPLPDGRPKPPR